MIYFTKGNFFGNLLHPFELKYRKFITKPTYPYNMCGIDLYILHVSYLPIQVLKTSLVVRAKNTKVLSTKYLFMILKISISYIICIVVFYTYFSNFQIFFAQFCVTKLCIYRVRFGCHTAASQQQMALNFELVVTN